MALIELQGVKKYYEMGSQVVKALDGINIAINKNDYLAFIGSPVKSIFIISFLLIFLLTATMGVLQNNPILTPGVANIASFVL